jgi:hypothetical protein
MNSECEIVSLALSNKITCICDRYNVRVGGPPVGAEGEEGFNVGDQTLGNLHSGGRVTEWSFS